MASPFTAVTVSTSPSTTFGSRSLPSTPLAAAWAKLESSFVVKFAPLSSIASGSTLRTNVSENELLLPAVSVARVVNVVPPPATKGNVMPLNPKLPLPSAVVVITGDSRSTVTFASVAPRKLTVDSSVR